MRLFHFSERGDIQRFEPRSFDPPRARPAGREWLNGSLVWAIDEWHQPLYLFPRAMPRVLFWPLAESSEEDLAEWWQGRTCRMVALIAPADLPAFAAGHTWRYELPAGAFESIEDAGMHVSREPVEPLCVERIGDLPGQLEQQGVALEVCRDFNRYRPLWDSTLHASGIHMRGLIV